MAEISQGFFDLLKAHDGVEKMIQILGRCDEKIGYKEATGPMTTADEFFAEYGKRRPKIEEFTDRIFKDYQISKHHLEGIRHDSTIEIWTNYGDAYFLDIQQDYLRYRTLSQVLKKF